MKEKKIGILFLILIILQVFVLYYQNAILPKKDLKNYKIGYVVVEDIKKGSEINKDNVKAVKIRKDSYLPIYISDFKAVENKVAKTNIYKGEMLSTTRIEDKKDNKKEGENKFELYIGAGKQNLRNIKKDDDVRVFVRLYNKKNKEVEVLNLLDNKNVEKIYYKESNKSGNATEKEKEVTGILVLVSDKELLNYYSANKLGEIIIAKYNDKEEPDLEVVRNFDYKNYIKEVEIDE